MANIYIGTSGFSYSDWKGKFYPENIKSKDWFSYYTQQFKTVEINSSFYHIPRQTTVKHWKEIAPKDFTFTFKASRYITHFKTAKFNTESIDKFFIALKIFETKTKKHIVLFQTPYFLKKSIDFLKELLDYLPKTFLYAFELRHESWIDTDVYKLLENHNAAFVMSDGSSWKLGKKIDKETGDFFYIRFHGPTKLYSSSYSKEDLKKYARLIKDKMKRNIDVYCYFNNDFYGYAIDNAKILEELLQ